MLAYISMQRQPAAPGTTPMSLPSTIPTAIIETVLAHLATLFLIGAKGDPETARNAALHMLAGYNPANEQELCLAADIISFALHGLEALGQSSAPDIPPARVLRLRSGAVSLNRESHRCRQKLEQLQRQAPAQQPQPESVTVPGRISAEAAIELVEQARTTVEAAKKNAGQGRYGGLTYAQALSKRMTAQRMADKAKRRADEHTARQNHRPEPAMVSAG